MLQRILLLFVAAVLLGCSGPRLPFEKDLPAESSIVAPPWEAFVKAGPGAEKELDMETLDGPGAAPPPLIAEMEAAGQDAELADPTPDPTPEPAPEKKSGTVIKAVAVPPVQGAKGKGNAELTSAMRQVLREAGWTVVHAPAKDALTIRGKVNTGAANATTQNVKLQWVVTTPDGKSLGEISQANDVPAGSLDQGWGENARFATEAAATGIFKLIQRFR
jgi:hypothetical protein